MDQISFCPKCRQSIALNNYFCPNCGKKIRSPPPSTSASGLIVLFLKTILLPPFGLYWGYLYLRQPDNNSKIIGLLTIVITVIESVWLYFYTVNLVTALQSQLTQQLNYSGL